MNEAAIISMIMMKAVALGFDPQVAVSVARTESNLNPSAIGAIGEVGLFQIRPEYFTKYSHKQLMDPRVNTSLGIQKLIEVKKECKHKAGITYVLCFNTGVAGGAKIKYPKLFPYVRKVQSNMKQLKGKLYGPFAF